MKFLYLASGNAGKLREFREGARPFGIMVEMLPGIREIAACIEDGSTFEANARKKAAYYSRSIGELVFADDSGLCVDALSGSPGVYSARYAGENATDEENNQKLLDELAQVRSPKWSAGAGSAAPGRAVSEAMNPVAHYVCAIALAEMGRVLAAFEGRVNGIIHENARGKGGFGYDPFFYAPQLSRTFAELEAKEKFAVSHRGIAFRKMVDYLYETGRLG